MKKFTGISYDSDKSRSLGGRFASFCSGAALGISASILTYLTVLSLLRTTDMNQNNAMLENVDFFWDSFFLNLLLLLAFAVGAFLWLILTDRIPEMLTVGVTLTLITAFGIWFVLSSQSAPTHDSYIVSNAAYHASLGDGSALASVYFKRFPFQLGYVLWSEGLIRLFGTENNYLSIEIVNVICLSVAYFAILRSVKLLWGEKRTVSLCAGLMLVTLPPILFCTFTYGTVPSLAFAALALWQVLCMKGDKRDYLHASLAALCIGLAVMLKKNSMILLAAIVILLLIRFIRRRSLACVLCVLLCLLSVWAFPLGAQKQYEKRFDLSFGKGIPMSSWLAMGLNDSYIASGWHDAKYTVINFNECNMDPKEANARSILEIKRRASELLETPKEAIAFFHEKNESQWNESSMQSIWTNQVRGQYYEKGALAAWICGEGEGFVKGFMNASLQFTYLFALVGCVLLCRTRRIEDALFPTCIIGGFLYHTLFEAKSQYILPYLVLLLPLVSRGLAEPLDWLHTRLKKAISKPSSPPTAPIDAPEATTSPTDCGFHLACGFSFSKGRRAGLRVQVRFPSQKTNGASKKEKKRVTTNG